jgi:hypothetical protein
VNEVKKILVIVVLIILMVVTNPNKDAYTHWSKEQLKNQSTFELVDLGIDYFAPTLIDSSTQVHDYIIFSIFETTFLDNHHKTIGIFKNFIPLSQGGDEASFENESEEQPLDVSEASSGSTVEESSSDEEYTSKPFVRDIKDIPINETLIWNGEVQNQSLDIHFNDGLGELIVGLDNPNGIRIMVRQKDNAWYLDWTSKGESPIYEFGTPESERYAVQGTTYDFDHDGNDEIIISIGDGLVEGELWIFKYNHNLVDSDTNPYQLLLTETFQEKVLIDDNKLMIPIGSQGYVDMYTFIDGEFKEFEM